MSDDGVLRGVFHYWRNGREFEEEISTETAAWILLNDAGVPSAEGCFVTERSGTFAWDDEGCRFSWLHE